MGKLIKAKHVIVREHCLKAHDGEGAAVDEALSRLREEAIAILAWWGRPFQGQLHFKLELEKPPMGEQARATDCV